MNWKELVISVDKTSFQHLLSEWRWLVPQNILPLWLSPFGDWMLRYEDGKIYFLDILDGSISLAAQSEHALNNLLQNEANQNRWLMSDWVGICRDRKLLLAQGQCYGWKLAPILGGKFEFQNIQLFDISVYECIMGQIHRQIKKLPEGFIITEFKIGSSQPGEAGTKR
jgi:hypothetical protein